MRLSGYTVYCVYECVRGRHDNACGLSPAVAVTLLPGKYEISKRRRKNSPPLRCSSIVVCTHDKTVMNKIKLQRQT